MLPSCNPRDPVCARDPRGVHVNLGVCTCLQARQAKAQAREQQYYQLVSASKSGPAADVAVDLQAASKSMSRQARPRVLSTTGF